MPGSAARLPLLFVRFALVACLVVPAAGARAQDEGDEGDRDDREVAEYDVDVDCAYDADADQTACTFAAAAGQDAKDVGHLDVPDAVVCSEVVGGDFEAVDPDPNTGVTGFKSKGEGGRLTLILAGEVTTGGTAAYAIKSGDGVFRVAGPGLVCGEREEAATLDRGLLRVVTYLCEPTDTGQTVFEAEAPETATGPACARAAGVDFAVAEADGAVVARAATDVLGEAEFALPPGQYLLSEGVRDGSADLTLTAGEAVTVGVAIPRFAAPDVDDPTGESIERAEDRDVDPVDPVDGERESEVAVGEVGLDDTEAGDVDESAPLPPGEMDGRDAADVDIDDDAVVVGEPAGVGEEREREEAIGEDEADAEGAGEVDVEGQVSPPVIVDDPEPASEDAADTEVEAGRKEEDAVGDADPAVAAPAGEVATPEDGAGDPADLVAAACPGMESDDFAYSEGGLLAQPFAAERGGLLEHVEVALARNAPGAFAVEVRDLGGGEDVASAPIVAKTTVRDVLATGADDPPRPLVAQFADPMDLVAGSRYALVVRFLGPQWFALQLAAGGACPGGVLVAPIPGEAFEVGSHGDLAYAVSVRP